MTKYMLVSFKTCPWVQRSAIILKEKNTPFEFRHIEPDNRPDWFLAISPHKNSVVADYTTDLERKAAEAILAADSVRFDGSDLMAGEVGSGSFWKGMTDYVSGSANLDQALETIQAGWANVKK